MSCSSGPSVHSRTKLRLGVCAMRKKSESVPMKEILKRIDEYHGDWINVIVFKEKVILGSEPDKWPEVDALIAFHSKGFPMKKAMAYAKLRKPYLVNDLEMQANLMMRRDSIYKRLRDAHIECPRYMVVDHRKAGNSVIETEDQIEFEGQVFVKPFVEKPVSAEDHNIYIYFPQCSGGGGQKLFRKVKNRSSDYCKDLKNIRRDGTYIYEDFIKTEGTDIKVYAIGKDYAHAEARKSPALDGRVQRDREGKEVRVPIMLRRDEKMAARLIVQQFKQVVCGFDILRTKNKSYVCDVNGFSFVKSSQKYYDDCARILGNLTLKQKALAIGIPWKMPYQPDDPPVIMTTKGTMMELRCVIAVTRHGDRTPKQKIKMKVTDPKLFEIYRKYLGKEKFGENKDEVKLKHPDHMREILKFAQEKIKELMAEQDAITEEPDSPTALEAERQTSSDGEDNLHKYQSVVGVLTMYKEGEGGCPVFSGINRKIQLKLLEKEQGNEKLQLILKWGGELTKAGIMQAEQLGQLFRTLYPGIDDGLSQYGNRSSRGLGFLRLHNTYRHDMKIYASDEGRVKLTAAAFAKGLLALEGELPPILQLLVKSANTDGLLDAEDKDAHLLQSTVKDRLHRTLQQDVDVDEDMLEELNPLKSHAIDRALMAIGNPKKRLDQLKDLIKDLTKCIGKQIEKSRKLSCSPGDTELPSGETWHTIYERWTKLLKDLYPNKEDMVYDISKVPDIYDCVKYDLQHNVALSNIFQEMNGLYFVSKCMAEVVVPQEYGITKNEKLRIAEGICLPLLTKMLCDLRACMQTDPDETENPSNEDFARLDPKASHGIATPLRHVRTRLYFTSESHIHSLMNLIIHRGLVPNPEGDEQWKRAREFLSRTCEFNYMTQLVLMLYEDKTKELNSAERFHLEVHFSPGLLPYYKGYCSFHPEAWYSAGGYRPKSSESSREHQKRRKHNSGPPGKKKNAGSGNSSGESDADQKASGATLINLDSKNDLNMPKITHEELAGHSPTSSPASTPNDEMRRQSATATAPAADKLAAAKVIQAYVSGSHHPQGNPTTRNLVFAKKLRNQLISTDVIRGICKEEDSSDDEETVPSAVLRTAVFARGNSAPDLKVFDCERSINEKMINQVGTFITPLRSLETLHNGLSFRDFDQLVEGICAARTPIPINSTPTAHISRENSSLSDSPQHATWMWLPWRTNTTAGK